MESSQNDGILRHVHVSSYEVQLLKREGGAVKSICRKEYQRS